MGKNHLVVLLGKKASRWVYALNLALGVGSLYFISENLLNNTTLSAPCFCRFNITLPRLAKYGLIFTAIEY